LEFNVTFSTKRLYRALQKLQFVKEFYFIEEVKDILLRGIAENVRELRMLIIFFSNLFFVYIAFG